MPWIRLLLSGFFAVVVGTGGGRGDMSLTWLWFLGGCLLGLVVWAIWHLGYDQGYIDARLGASPSRNLARQMDRWPFSDPTPPDLAKRREELRQERRLP